MRCSVAQEPGLAREEAARGRGRRGTVWVDLPVEATEQDNFVAKKVGGVREELHG